MIVWGVILLIVGGLVAYFGRPREQLLVVAGVIIFCVGLVLILLAILPSDVDLEAGVLALPLLGLAVPNTDPPGIPLSPTVRWLLTGFLTAATAAVTILSDGFQPLPDVLLILIALGMGLGLIPPQTGGTQKGVLSPSITEPPAANVDEAFGGARYIKGPRKPRP